MGEQVFSIEITFCSLLSFPFETESSCAALVDLELALWAPQPPEELGL